MAFDDKPLGQYAFARKVHFGQYLVSRDPDFRLQNLREFIVFAQNCTKVVNTIKIPTSVRYASRSTYLTVILTFDLLNSKYNQLIAVPTCTSDVNLAKFPQVVCKILCSPTISIDMITHAW